MRVSNHVYGSSFYQLSKEFIKSVSMIETKRGMCALVFVWLSIIILTSGILFFLPKPLFWYLYLPMVFLIAGRQGALLQLMHEAAHGSLCEPHWKNELIGLWGAALPIGIHYEGYKKAHAFHHAYTNVNDPREDSEKIKVTNFCDIRLYLLFLKDLLGITALQVFLRYAKWENTSSSSMRKHFWTLCICQCVLGGALFHFQVLDYILLWLIPAMSPHMFLMRIRGIAEHGLAKQLGIDVTEASQGVFYTRSFLTPMRTYRFRPLVWLEKILIGSLSVYFHHEHHLFPQVPFYNLRKIHDKIAPNVYQKNPDVYAAGYFSAAMRNLYFI